MTWNKKNQQIEMLAGLRQSTVRVAQYILRRSDKFKPTKVLVDLKEINRYVKRHRGRPYDPKTLKEAIAHPQLWSKRSMSKQLSLFAVEDKKTVSSTNAVEDGKRQAIQRYLDRASLESAASISTYSPNGRKTEYYRLVYRERRKVKAIHIKGGNTRARLARYRARELQKLIDRGADLAEIIEAAKTFNGM